VFKPCALLKNRSMGFGSNHFNFIKLSNQLVLTKSFFIIFEIKLAIKIKLLTHYTKGTLFIKT
jgi:hypothetical protein